MSTRASEFPTLREILSSTGGGKSPTAKAMKNLHMATVPRREATVLLTPEQLAGIRVPLQRIAGDQIRGYQRHLDTQKARDFAKYLETFDDDSYLKIVPVIEVSITDDQLFYTDGQHRAAGAALAGKPIEAKLTKRSMAQARELFSLQRKAKSPSRTVGILNGTDELDVYIQDAVTSPGSHAWKRFVTSSNHGPTDTRLSAATVETLLNAYMGRARDNSPRPFDPSAADELAGLLSAFGTKSTNKPAFRAKSLGAIARVAKVIFRDRKPHPEDKGRWATHMLGFEFAYVEYMPVKEITLRLKQHWNKGLPRDSARRIPME